MQALTNEIDRFGSAAFADRAEIARAGLFRQTPDSLLAGFFGDKPLWYGGAGGVLMVAGARGGKLRDILAYNLCTGICTGTVLILDMKGECAAISRDQTADAKHCYYWNPCGLHGLPKNRINPVDYIRADSPSLVSDVKVFCENTVPPSGSANGAYFEGRARELIEAVILTLVRLNGVLTLPDLYGALNLIPGGGAAWLDFAFEMADSGFPLSVRMEEEIAASRHESGDGFKSILGESFKAIAPLSDPVLMDSVSPPYDFSMAQLCDPARAHQVYLMPPAEFVAAWAPVIKAIFVAGMIYKSRAPHAPRQTWMLDECAQLGGFPLVTRLFTYGAGIGIRPFAVFQSIDQMRAVGPGAETIIPGSAACRLFFAIRDLDSATAISRMLGAQTLAYDDPVLQARARHAKHQALQSLIAGGDPLAAGLNYAHHAREAAHRSKQHRALRTPDEVLNTPSDRLYLFADGLRHPVYAERQPYYAQRFMAGRYHPNPYHPPADRVRVKLAVGTGTRRVIREAVPARYAGYPQYRGGLWSRIGG